MEFPNASFFRSYLGELSSSGLLQSTLFQIFTFTAIILVYSLFVFYSYRLFSKKNLFDFNFSQYLNTDHAAITSLFGFLVYLLEYLIILPFFIVIWFSFYSIFLLILARNLEVQTILLICTALIASIRISSFTNENLSQDLAKMLPFTLLALALMGERFFSLELIIDRILTIPTLFSLIPIYLVFLFIIEFLFRFVDAVKIFIIKE